MTGTEPPVIHQQIFRKMNISSINRKGIIAVPFFCAALFAACDKQVYDDLEPCPSDYHLKFRYDYNMKYADAFPSEVDCVAVWAFDNNGKLVWKHRESLETLQKDKYKVRLPLQQGKYDFVTWCGHSSESPFIIDSEIPASPSELGMTLSLSGLTKADNAIGISNTCLSGLYHSIKKGVDISHDPNEETDTEIGLSLTKDTNYFKVLLQNLDGSVMNEDDFSFYITGGNTRLEHDNSPGESDEFHYHPWSISSAVASIEGSKPELGAVTSVSSVLAELHTSRIMKDSKSELVVHRNSDDKDIIRIPLVDYLLLVKGNYRKMSDQEYLDRQDEYALTFFIDKENNWQRMIGIYINAWHIVPPQDNILH